MSSHTGINEHKRADMEQYSKKFLRRSDLTPLIRLYIAFAGLMSKSVGIWGTITELSKRFMVSRTFIYMLAATLEEISPIIFGDNASPPAIETRLPYYYMLSLRMEGRCSIEAISTIMKRFTIDNSSTGSISQVLQSIGSLLPHTLNTGNDEVQLVVFLSDEIFSKRIPILVTVEPHSSTILRIELADARGAEEWKKHWRCLAENGYCAVYLVTDEGKGLCVAQKEALADIIRQPDTYHAVAHRLGQWVKILENAAYKAIEAEDECYRKLDSARTDPVINKRIDEYEKAKKWTDEKIELYENFSFLYECLINEFHIFDGNGKLRDRKKAEGTIRIVLELMETLGKTKIINAVNKVRRTLPELLNYFEVAESVISDLQKLPIDQEALQTLCLAWQWRKGIIKSKKPAARKYCAANENYCLELAASYLQDDYDLVKEQVYIKLDSIVHSSSLVECINSIIRPYLNSSKNNITQETLNLIMFYHNHRRYNSGKRRGKTPMEILTGKKQEKDWVELLFDNIKNKAPLPFASSFASSI